MAKTALVTGASSGIGREIARDLSARGFRAYSAQDVRKGSESLRRSLVTTRG